MVLILSVKPCAKSIEIFNRVVTVRKPKKSFMKAGVPSMKLFGSVMELKYVKNLN